MMVGFLPFISLLFFITFCIFSYYNLKILTTKYDAVRKTYSLGASSFFKQFKYFSIAEHGVTPLNALAALLFGIGGMYLRIGVFGPIFGVIAGWFLPKVVSSRLRTNYLKKLEVQLHSALILIGNATKAGETLPQALESIKTIIGNPMAQEFEIVLQQIRVGMSVENALLDMAKRIPLEEFNLAIQAIIISIKTGANLPIALKKIADTIQQRELFHKKLNSLTVQGRAEGIIVGLLPFCIGLLLYVTDHTYIEVLFKTFLGNCVIAIMITLEVFAYFAIKRICTVKF
jgi:tight adherence protein B